MPQVLIRETTISTLKLFPPEDTLNLSVIHLVMLDPAVRFLIYLLALAEADWIHAAVNARCHVPSPTAVWKPTLLPSKIVRHIRWKVSIWALKRFHYINQNTSNKHQKSIAQRVYAKRRTD